MAVKRVHVVYMSVCIDVLCFLIAIRLHKKTSRHIIYVSFDRR